MVSLWLIEDKLILKRLSVHLSVCVSVSLSVSFCVSLCLSLSLFVSMSVSMHKEELPAGVGLWIQNETLDEFHVKDVGFPVCWF